MRKTLVLLYGGVAYLLFFGTILYMIGFLGDFAVPKGIDDGRPGGIWAALGVDLSLILLFAVQHTVMARPAFKRWWTRYLPWPMERSTFVALASLLLLLAFWQWRPIPGTVWEIEAPAGRAALYALFALGWFLVFFSSFLIDHFDLFGLRQAYLHFRGRPYSHVPMKVVSLYRWVRNPLMLGFLVAIWATPLMTAGHLLFALAMSAYILVGIRFEERTIERELGEIYRAYCKRTPMLVPIPGRSATAAGAAFGAGAETREP